MSRKIKLLVGSKKSHLHPRKQQPAPVVARVAKDPLKTWPIRHIIGDPARRRDLCDRTQ